MTTHDSLSRLTDADLPERKLAFACPIPAVAPASAAASVPASEPPQPPPAIVRPLAPQRYKLQVTISAETRATLRRAQDLLRHTETGADEAASSTAR